jgi:hypothetical protein
MKRRPPYCEVNRETGHIAAVLQDRTVDCEVPSIFGEVLSAEVRGDFIVAHTARGKASFHASSKLVGKMPWHAMLKAFRHLCLMDMLAGRVGFYITHYPYKSGGRGRSGVAGRVVVDGEIVYKGIEDPGPDEFAPSALGFALAAYLNLTPISALASSDPIVRALALIDRRLGDAEFLALAPVRGSEPLWLAFHRLRSSVACGR